MKTSFKTSVFFAARSVCTGESCCISKWKFNLYCGDFVGQHRCLVTVAPQRTDKSHKNFEQFALRRLHARATEDPRATAVSGTHPPLHRVICQATRYMYLEY